MQKSEQFALIMEKFNEYGHLMSRAEFYKVHVATRDPKISLDSFKNFIRTKKIVPALVNKNAALLERIQSEQMTEIDLERNSMRKILAVADITLDELVNDPTVLLKIPVDLRMKWLFQVMKARDSRVKAMVKKREDDRKQTSYDELMNQAQYGGTTLVDSEPISPDTAVPVPDRVVEILQSKKETPPAGGVVEFKPEDL